MPKTLIPILLILLSCQELPAQQTRALQIEFVPTFNGKVLLPGDEFTAGDTDPNHAATNSQAAQPESPQIETLRFYVSKLRLVGEPQAIQPQIEQTKAQPQVTQLSASAQAEASHYLVDFAKPASLKLEVNLPQNSKISHLQFAIGVDSATSVSGALGGDLDPAYGMYWTWQSGYINFKLEGEAQNCPARHNRFQYHIGGYQAPFNSLRMLKLKLPESALKSGDVINVELKLERFFDKVNPAEVYQVMSPNQQALHIADVLPTLFVVRP